MNSRETIPTASIDAGAAPSVKALRFTHDTITEVSLPVTISEGRKEVRFDGVRPLIDARLVEVHMFALAAEGVGLSLMADEEGWLRSDATTNEPFRQFTERSVGLAAVVAGSVVLIATDDASDGDVDLPQRLLTEARDLPTFREDR